MATGHYFIAARPDHDTGPMWNLSRLRSGPRLPHPGYPGRRSQMAGEPIEDALDGLVYGR